MLWTILGVGVFVLVVVLLLLALVTFIGVDTGSDKEG